MDQQREPSAEEQVELTQFEALSATWAVTDTEESVPPSRFEFLGTVGKGAMGEVLLARDPHLGRHVAYKKIHSQMAGNRQVMSRFFSEAQITAQLDHPAIIPIYNLEVTPEGQIAYTMKLIKGKTLKELIQETQKRYSEGQPIDDNHSLNHLLGHFLKVCDALYFSHTKGVIHRDLKPANIMIGPYNEVYVMDWGIARVMGGHEERMDEEVVKLIQPDQDAPPLERTQMGMILGTPRYLSPEQAAGKNDQLDGRSDQFALGLILFELITLKPSFVASSPIDLLKKTLKAEKEPMVHVSPKVRIPHELAAIVHKATARKRDQRYASVQEMADDLRRYLRGEAVLAQPDTHIQKIRRWMAQHRQLTLTLMAGILLLSMGTAAGFITLRRHAMLQARHHEQARASFLEAVASESRDVDQLFFIAETALEVLQGLSTEALARGERSPAPIYTNKDFAQNPPPGTFQAPRYGQSIHLDWPVFVIAPGVSTQALQPQLAQLNRLRYDLRRLFVHETLKGQPVPPPSELQQLVGVQGVPLRSVYVGLKTGVMMSYPGRSGYHEDFDPRQRPWYQQAQKQQGPHWLKPYAALSGQDWLLPCTQALYGDQYQFLGVAGVELSLQDLAERLTPRHPYIREAVLLNDQFEVVLRRDRTPLASGSIRYQPERLADEAAVSAMRQQEAGYVESPDTLTVFYRLNALGWTYMAIADRDTVLRGGQP